MKNNFKDVSKSDSMLDRMSLDHAIYNERIYPLLGFDSNNIPDLGKWEVGKEYKIVIKTKLKRKVDKGEGKVDGEFQILMVAAEDEDDELNPTQKRYKNIMT